jgi:proteasome accessory factor B
VKKERESAGTTERQLNLLSALLKARGPLSWAELGGVEGYGDAATPLRTRQKRFERDLKSLEAAGLKIERSQIDLRQHYELDRGACLLPALNLTSEQRVLMFRVGMSYMQGDQDSPLRRHLSSALMKLQAGAGSDALPVTLPQTFVRRTLNRRPGETSRLDVICPALLERRKIKFDYAGRDSKAPDKRVVAPYALVARRGGWYLVGYDVAKQAERTFRLSRMRGAVSLATPREAAPEYEVPHGFDPERSFSADVFGSGESAFRDVRIAFDAEVGFIVENEFAGIYDIKARKDGSIVLHLPQAYPEELLRYLGEFAGHWEVQHPPELRKLVVRRLKNALAEPSP